MEADVGSPSTGIINLGRSGADCPKSRWCTSWYCIATHGITSADSRHKDGRTLASVHAEGQTTNSRAALALKVLQGHLCS